MNISDILINRRWNFYQELAPKISKEIYTLLQCYDENTPYIPITPFGSYYLPEGGDETIYLRVKAERFPKYKVFLFTLVDFPFRRRDWWEVQDLGLLCEIYSNLSFMSAFKEPKALAKNQCMINVSKLLED